MLKDAIEALRLGAWDYILKPVHDMGILTHAVSRALERARLLAENKQFYKQLHDQNIQLQQEITRRRHAEEELLELNQQLQAANASKDKFFSIIAHDLRSPFTALIGLTEAIVEDIDAYSKDRIKSILHRLHESSKQVYTLLTNLLTWSRLQRGLIEHHVEQVPLNGIVSYIINLFSAAARQKQITLKNQVPAGLSVYADQNMVNTIIRNLISNALKFTGPNGTITVSARQGEKTVEVAVSDTGIGMNQEEMEKIFRIDAKYSKPGTAGEEGTGLGLILCQELVQKNGGSIRVDSEPGQGTTFTIHLPGVPD